MTQILFRRCLARTVLALSAALSMGQLAPLPAAAAPRDIVTLGGQKLERAEFERLVATTMAKHKVPGAQVALLDRGRLVYAHNFGVSDVETGAPVTGGTLFEAASLSKPLFGLLAMSFVERGELDLDRPLATYLPFPEISDDPRAAKITARMVLTHQSGLPNWRRNQPEGLKLAFDPGTSIRYSGEGYEYLARVLMKIADTDNAGLDALFVKRIAKPLGLKDTRFWATPAQLARRAAPHEAGKRIAFEPRGTMFGAAFGIHSNATDFARYAAAVVRAKGALRPESWAAYLAPQSVPIPPDYPERARGLADWALGPAIYDLQTGRVYLHSGNNEGYTCLVVADRKTGRGLTVFTNADQAGNFLLELYSLLGR